MYFLVSIPPKTFGAVRPAFSALSVKFAMAGGGGLGGFVSCADDDAPVISTHPQASTQAMTVRKEEEIGNPMSQVDVRGGLG